MHSVVDELLKKLRRAKTKEKAKIIEEISHIELTTKYDVVKLLDELIEILSNSSGELKKAAIMALVRIREKGALNLLFEEIPTMLSVDEQVGLGDLFAPVAESMDEKKDGLVISDFAEIFKDFHVEGESPNQEEGSEKEQGEEEKKKAREKREKYPDLMDFEIPED
jgi:hypothetical protein